MIVKEMALLSLSGPDFRPAEAEEKLGIKFTKSCAPGSIVTRGRYRGLPSPDGSAAVIIERKADEELFEGAATLADQIVRFGADWKALGVTDIGLDVTFGYEAQCNLEIRPEILQRIAQAGITLSISCYETEERGD